MTLILAGRVRRAGLLARITFAALVLYSAAPCDSWAQTPAMSDGAVAGVVVTVEHDGGSVPVAYALVQLVRVLPGAEGRELARTLTNAAGDFRFDAVAPGTYRVKLDRIGYAPEVTPPFTVTPGEIAHQRIVATTVPVALDAFVVRPPPACYTASRLSRDRRLSALWQEVQNGIEARSLLDRQFALRYVLRQVTATEPRGSRGASTTYDTTVTLIQGGPEADDDALVERQGRRLGLRLPSERELLGVEFLDSHCLENSPEREQGAWRLRFRPVRTRRNQVDVRGSIWVDTATLHVQRLQLEYLHGSRPFFRAEIQYADVRLPGGPLRLPDRGTFLVIPTRGVRVEAERISGTLHFEAYETAPDRERPPDQEHPEPA